MRLAPTRACDESGPIPQPPNTALHWNTLGNVLVDGYRALGDPTPRNMKPDPNGQRYPSWCLFPFNDDLVVQLQRAGRRQQLLGGQMGDVARAQGLLQVASGPGRQLLLCAGGGVWKEVWGSLVGESCLWHGYKHMHARTYTCRATLCVLFRKGQGCSGNQAPKHAQTHTHRHQGQRRSRPLLRAWPRLWFP